MVKNQVWAYARVSSFKQKKHNTIAEQVKPLTNYLKKFYLTKNQINKHLYYETFTGMTMNRPKFQDMMHKVKKGDTITFYKLDRMARSLDSADAFIRKCRRNDITIHILKGGFNLDPNTSIGLLQIHLFLAMVQFDHDTILDRFHAGRLRAKENGKLNWNGGIKPRFYGKHKKHYAAIYKYAKTHSMRETAKVFDCSPRTVGRVRRSGKEYYKNKEYKVKGQTNINDYIKK